MMPTTPTMGSTTTVTRMGTEARMGNHRPYHPLSKLPLVSAPVGHPPRRLRRRRHGWRQRQRAGPDDRAGYRDRHQP
jgi:hypothetical protein